ncbi:hypothetical protein DICVIV_08088 [Dictyocaulus viviparus]|uniref:Major sperm protein n=1 Tax=Dictyocaulus viviparus TaxID=29172 RepID=A0A0D8XMV4_DICVI|nr:hypothetical protein DICVIV_08088 [Dictyocaulus viviparus]
MKVHVTTLVLPTGTGSCHTKQIIIRNTTRQDIVLKIKSDAPRAIHFEAEKIVVDSRKYVVVNMVFNERELSSSPKGSESKVRIYARPVTKYNQECLRRWLTAENCEMTSQLAFLIELRLDNYIYSASKLILDLPGQASLVDPIPRAIQACVDEDCVTGINIDKTYRITCSIIQINFVAVDILTQAIGRTTPKSRYDRNFIRNARVLPGSESKVRIYARPVTKYNQECLRRWLTAENCEMTSQLAFLIELRLDNYIYSASKLILDLPGQASLVDPIPRAIQACVDEDCVTGINIDAGKQHLATIENTVKLVFVYTDTNTATVFDDKDYRLAVQLQEDHNASRHVTFASIKVLLLK